MTLRNRTPFTPSWGCLVLLLPCFFLWVQHCIYSCLLFLVRVGPSSHPVNNSLDPNSVIPHFCHLYPFWLRVIYTFDEQALYISSWDIEFKKKKKKPDRTGPRTKSLGMQIQSSLHTSTKPFISIDSTRCLLNCLCPNFSTMSIRLSRHYFWGTRLKVQKPLSSLFSCQRKRLHFPYAKLITFSRIHQFCFLSFVFSTSLFFLHPTSIST